MRRRVNQAIRSPTVKHNKYTLLLSLLLLLLLLSSLTHHHHRHPPPGIAKRSATGSSLATSGGVVRRCRRHARRTAAVDGNVCVCDQRGAGYQRSEGMLLLLLFGVVLIVFGVL
jgi:hypothetical protein